MNQPPVQLRRVLTTPLLTLYGLGVTIGAGIYVLVGVAAGMAGTYAPISFIVAAIVVAFVAMSYAEFSVRFPVSAGEAAYVRAGLKSKFLAVIVGLMVAVTGIVSAAAIAIGATDYLISLIGSDLAPAPPLITAGLIIVLGIAAAKGISESVYVAAFFTLVEIGGLLFAIWFGIRHNPDILTRLPDLIPPIEGTAAFGSWAGIFAASLIAFFAFVGFEDIVNVAEEVKQPSRTLPRAILLTLLISTAIYIAVVAIVVLALPADAFSNETPALVMLFADNTAAASVFNAIAVFATLNGVLIQMIMASRIIYGLAAQRGFSGTISRHLSVINPTTRTPLRATILVVLAIMVLSLTLPIIDLAEWTSRIVLATFSIVSLSLLVLKLRERSTGNAMEAPGYNVPIWVPAIAVIASLGLLFTDLV